MSFLRRSNVSPMHTVRGPRRLPLVTVLLTLAAVLLSWSWSSPRAAASVRTANAITTIVVSHADAAHPHWDDAFELDADALDNDNERDQDAEATCDLPQRPPFVASASVRCSTYPRLTQHQRPATRSAAAHPARGPPAL